ncbi:MAG: hypothetical protein SOS98_02345 [Varibaculum sp.]|nr:hypothetical protein [Varibaculum sp.]
MWIDTPISVIERPDNQLQLGSDPNTSTILSQVSARDATLIRKICSVKSPADMRRLRSNYPQVTELEKMLVAAGYGVQRFHDYPEIRWAERMRVPSPEATRASATIAISGLGRVGEAAARLFAHSGIGKIQLSGTEASMVAAELADSPSAVTAQPYLTPSVAIRVTSHTFDLAWARECVNDRVAHLPIVIHESSIDIGPFVVVGVSPCLECVMRQRAEYDPDATAVAAQLGGAPEITPDIIVANRAAAFAASQTINYLQGYLPETVSSLWRINPLEAVATWEKQYPYRDCRCRL